MALTKPARICACSHRVPADTLCACQRAKKAEADKARPGARQRGYDRAYQVAAADFLRKYPVCVGDPGSPCGAPAVVVRHKVSIRKRPDLKMDRMNWLPGCKRCNARDYQRERQADAKRGVVNSSQPATSGPEGGQSRGIFPVRAAKFEVI